MLNIEQIEKVIDAAEEYFDRGKSDRAEWALELAKVEILIRIAFLLEDQTKEIKNARISQSNDPK